MLFASRWEHANRPSRSRRSSAAGAATILLIGGAIPRNTYRGILSQAGYDIVDAGEAEEGLSLARKLRPNLIMVELGMPVRDGWETHRMLKGDPETHLIPVVALSLAALPTGIYHRARSAGFVDYLAKPVERRHVLEVVATWTSPPAQVIV